MAEPAYQMPLPTTGIPVLGGRWPTEAELPYDDGEPLPEADYQFEPLTYAHFGVKAHNKHRVNVAVQADMFVHYKGKDEQGNDVVRSVAPDVFVILDVPNRQRFSYVVYEEGKPPDFVLEVLSTSTWRRDTGEKKDIYESLGVREYWIFDPYDRFLDAPLVGYRLRDGCYEPIAPVTGLLPKRHATPGNSPNISYLSEVLGLEFRVEGGTLRIRDPETGEYLKSYGELDEANSSAEKRADLADSRAEQADSRADQAESRAGQAERRIAELEAALRKLNRDRRVGG